MFRKLFGLFLLLGATHAAATPPDTIYIDDRIFGVNKTHVFILRTTNDNLGLHIFGMKDTYLVAKNIDTGLDDEIWPVLRQHGATDYDQETGDPIPLISTFPLEGAVNPFSVLVERGGLKIETPIENLEGENYVPLSPGDLEIRDYTLSADDIIRQMEHAVATTLGAMQPYPEYGFASMTFSTPQILLEGWSVDSSECGWIGNTELGPIYGMRSLMIVKIECWDYSMEQPASLFVIMNPKIEDE